MGDLEVANVGRLNRTSTMNSTIQRSAFSRMLFLGLCTATLLALAACAHIDPMRALRLGSSSRADVLASQGQPRRVWQDADGGSTLEYSEQPYGQRAFMFKLDAQGRLLAFRDALDSKERERAVAGMTMDEVQRLLGQERTRVFFSLSEEDVWDWNIAPDGTGALRRFNVHFKAGLVLRTSYSMVYRERWFLFKD
jgi:hypothetical protein